MRTTTLTIATRATSVDCTLIVSGELDVESAVHLDRAIAGASEYDVISVDLARVTFCDSRALECLIRNTIARRDSGRELRLANPSVTIERLLTLTQTQRFFDR